jgi:diguanylate cyclase (GGDEF)-like protein
VRSAIAAALTPIRGQPGQHIQITASAGVASSAELSDAGAHELYRAADAALYRAKTQGRNCTVVAGDPVWS